MALITIAGVDIPSPSDYQVSIMDLSKADRNANGTMIIERIATKRKLELSWSYLSRTDLATILALVSTVTFKVKYLDPQTNSILESTFYCGDRSVGMIDFVNSVPRYKDIKFNLIER